MMSKSAQHAVYGNVAKISAPIIYILTLVVQLVSVVSMHMGPAHRNRCLLFVFFTGGSGRCRHR